MENEISEIEQLKNELEQHKKEAEEYLNGWKRAKADYMNYKRDEMARVQEFGEYARNEVLLKVFPVLDNLERAEKQIPVEQKNEQVFKGFFQIISQWKEFLRNQDIREIETVGNKFNPEFHEAVAQVEGSSVDGESGIIVEETEKGYTIHGKLLRPAKVKVAK